ncbi:histidine-type phosphatase [Oryzifoliimicrobium ureilyticus]|uniref:histidine-type phosphatase n=1 Tax=Oryzifoliimicrobium ureilyticus TaxID=3113724 RepID=UPI0030764681
MISKTFLCKALLVLVTLCAPAYAQDLTLDKYVVLMRHGVRPQTDSKEIEALSSRTWPTWEVADGQLTPHGAKAAAQLARWEGGMLRSRGLLPKEGCPAPGDVFGWANGSVQRTIDTGNVMLATMFPGCGLRVGFNKVDDAHPVDPLYAPSDTSLGAVDPAKAKAAILEAAGGSLDKPRAKAAALMHELDGILNCCAPALCENTEQAACSLSNRPWKIKEKKAKGDRPASVEVVGPLKEAATVVQVFLLQYANGFPLDKVAFSTVKKAQDIIRLSELRQIKYDLSVRVPYLAARDGSNILNQLLLAVASAPGATTADGPPNGKFILFAGSDTQQAEIGAILGVHWHIPPYLDDETPPTGTLVFERLHDAEGKFYVRLKFIAPSLDQIRDASALTRTTPPIEADISLPGCETLDRDGACPLDKFLELTRAKLDMTAVAKQSYGSR